MFFKKDKVQETQLEAEGNLYDIRKYKNGRKCRFCNRALSIYNPQSHCLNVTCKSKFYDVFLKLNDTLAHNETERKLKVTRNYRKKKIKAIKEFAGIQYNSSKNKYKVNTTRKFAVIHMYWFDTPQEAKKALEDFVDKKIMPKGKRCSINYYREGKS